MRLPLDQRIKMSSWIDDNGCWIWKFRPNKGGYGRIQLSGDRRGKFLAHRISYEVFKGEIPAGLHLDHLCRVRLCVNPEHLEPVTCRENLLRGDTFQAANAAKTECPQGHVLNNRGSDGKRRCKQCNRDENKRLYWRKKNAQ